MQKHYSWLIDPTTGDYAISNGDPQRDESVQFAAYLRLKLKRGSWLYAPGDNYGSDFATVRKRTANAPQLLIAVANRALAPLKEDERVATIEVESTGSARHAEELDITLQQQDGNITSFILNPVGS